MIYWEYMRLVAYSGERLCARMNEAGMMGWEVIVVERPSGNVCVAWAKRETTKDNANQTQRGVGPL